MSKVKASSTLCEVEERAGGAMGQLFPSVFRQKKNGRAVATRVHHSRITIATRTFVGNHQVKPTMSATRVFARRAIAI
jgi:hypothetical protein